MRRLMTMVVVVGLLLGTTASSGFALTAPTFSATTTGPQLARQILESVAAQFFTPTERLALRTIAADLGPDDPAGGSFLGDSGAPGVGLPSGTAAPVGPAITGTGLANVRVNNPAEDTHAAELTTQHDPSIAVSGQNVAVGFTDTQHALLGFTQGADLSGFAYSTDGGQTFTDGGVVPDAGGTVNLGEGSLASDGRGAMYYAMLTADVPNQAAAIGVAKSTNGGRTWSEPVNVTAALESLNPNFYVARRPVIVSAPSGLYVGWNDLTFQVKPCCTLNSGLAVARSTDGGATWTTSYASSVGEWSAAPNNCFVLPYMNAQPLVAPNGTVYVAAEGINICQDTTSRYGYHFEYSQVIASSTNAGATWTPGGTLLVKHATGDHCCFVLGAGQYMWNPDYPALGYSGGALYMAWSDSGDPSGHSHIKLARSTDAGNTWATSFVTSGSNDEVQPAVSTDSAGLHILYYEVQGAGLGGEQGGGDSAGGNFHGQMNVAVSNSADGVTWTVRRVTSQSFAGTATIIPFDVISSWANMGIYLANVSDGVNQYFAWSDNRDVVTNWLWPSGRQDPDVFMAKQ